MKRRPATLVLAGVVLALGACSPSTSAPAATASGGGPRTGTLKVWLFEEPNRAPKEAVVKEAVAEFTAAHPGTTVDVAYIAVETRSARFKGAFNDPASAPDVVEYGNTDLPEYADAGGLAEAGGDITTIASAQSRAGLTSYTDLIRPDICPAPQCADLTGGKTVELFAAGKAGMGILGNFNRGAVDAGVARQIDAALK
jgi:maltose-binding protein MalE